MANAPISLPPISEPLVDPRTGLISPSWYQSFFLFMLQRTGGTSGIFTSDVKSTADEALSTANAADALSNVVSITANSALTKATEALNSATSITGNALLKPDNLGDLLDVSVARDNLGLNTVPLKFQFDSPTAGALQFVPIVQTLIMQANFGGMNSYTEIPPGLNPIFIVKYLRGNNQIPIGNLFFHHQVFQCTGSLQPAVVLIPGDVLMIMAPITPDPLLHGVNITFQMIVG